MKKLIILLAIAFITTTSFAQMSQMDHSKMKNEKSDTANQMKYVCPMHDDVKSDKPGKCPKCGMTLVKIKTYTCPMHKEVTSNKPGKCPKCGMNLVEKMAVSEKKTESMEGMKMK